MSYQQHPVHRLWVAAGSPAPIECDGTAIAPRAMAPGVCAVTGGPGEYLYEQAFSANFTLPRNASTAFRHGHGSTAQSRRTAKPQKCLSAAAVWSSKAIVLRCATWILEPAEDGDRLTFHPSYRVPKDPEKAATWRSAWGDADPSRWLSWLLQPRPVGTVAAIPKYGIEHGGEQNFHRTYRPGHVPPDPLLKLQSKHVAVYAQPSTRAGVPALQVDSDVVIEVDTARWRPAHALALALARRLRELDVPAPAVSRALQARVLEHHYPAAAHAALASTLFRLGDLPRHPFWSLFSGGIHV